MSTKLKKIADQVIVITGASSGIGLATAEAAAARRASLVLVARSEQTLNAIVREITAAGGKAIAVTCDVADRKQVEAVAAAAIQHFGRIDTWVNNAGLGMYGRTEETQETDARRLFDINFWGAVNGCQVALPHLKTNGGALITVGSEETRSCLDNTPDVPQRPPRRLGDGSGAVGPSGEGVRPDTRRQLEQIRAFRDTWLEGSEAVAGLAQLTG